MLPVTSPFTSACLELKNTLVEGIEPPPFWESTHPVVIAESTAPVLVELAKVYPRGLAMDDLVSESNDPTKRLQSAAVLALLSFAGFFESNPREKVRLSTKGLKITITLLKALIEESTDEKVKSSMTLKVQLLTHHLASKLSMS